MDIYDRLEEDHRLQEKLAKQIKDTSGDSEARRTLFAQLKQEAEAHANAEEQTFYAALIAIPNGQEEARHSVTEHEVMSKLIEELEELDMASGGWIHKFEKFKHKIEHHIKEEEKDVFPLAKKLIDDDTAKAMVEPFENRKSAEEKEAA